MIPVWKEHNRKMKMNLNQFVNRYLDAHIYKVDEWHGTGDRVVMGMKNKLWLVDVLSRLKESEVLKKHRWEITVKLNTKSLSTITVERGNSNGM